MIEDMNDDFIKGYQNRPKFNLAKVSASCVSHGARWSVARE